jgi:hypothetical protein
MSASCTQAVRMATRSAHSAAHRHAPPPPDIRTNARGLVGRVSPLATLGLHHSRGATVINRICSENPHDFEQG